VELASNPATSGNSDADAHVYQIGGDYFDCAYISRAQCAASASGRSALCVDNPYFANVQGRGAPRYGR
jgi:Tfp pilus assembly protein PilV